MVRQYESIFIVDSHLPNEQIEACIVKHTQLIEKSGGKIKLIDRWGKKRLAFEIAKKQYGFYVYVRFESEGKFCQELNRSFKLDDTVIRFLTVAVPKAALKTETEPKALPQGKATEEGSARNEAAASVSKPIHGGGEV
jgi:small subunit ribosomal protein S6